MTGEQVVLTSEPGVDRDRYDRELRYVSTDGGDFGEAMVGADHTAVYAGHNDASPTYQSELRALDANGRTCDDSIPPAVTESDSDDSTYVPTPDRSSTPPSSSSGSSSGGAAYYQNCSAARAAGAAPLHTGDPGYSRKLDRDGDGVACE